LALHEYYDLMLFII